jgi:hypothetical protein
MNTRLTTSGFEVEQPIGVDIDLVFRRGGQAHQKRVEVAEDGAVLLVHGAVRCVDDDEVEVPHTEATLPVLRFIDQTHLRRIGRNEHSALAIPFGDEVHRRGIG